MTTIAETPARSLVEKTKEEGAATLLRPTSLARNKRVDEKMGWTSSIRESQARSGMGPHAGRSLAGDQLALLKSPPGQLPRPSRRPYRSNPVPDCQGRKVQARCDRHVRRPTPLRVP